MDLGDRLEREDVGSPSGSNAGVATLDLEGTRSCKGGLELRGVALATIGLTRPELFS